MEISTIGIDLGKTTFHLIGLSPRGDIVLRKKLSRKQLLTYTATRKPMLIGMEACAGAHYLARALRDQGHDARLMPAQYVKPYVKTNKNDYLDAEAIAEAVQRAAGSASATPRTQSLGREKNGRDESDTRISPGTWDCYPKRAFLPSDATAAHLYRGRFFLFRKAAALDS
jgi:transposase